MAIFFRFLAEMRTFAHPLKRSVAQLVEQLTLNQRVQGSSPCGPTIKDDS